MGAHVDPFGYGSSVTFVRISYVSVEQFVHPPVNMLEVYDPSSHTTCVGVAVGVADGGAEGVTVGLVVGDTVGLDVGLAVGL